MSRLSPVSVVRVLTTALVAAYLMAMYLEWNPDPLSKEANAYRQVVADTMNGFSPEAALQKLAALIGWGLGAVGAVLLWMRLRFGLACMIWCAPVLTVAALLGATWPYYPDIEGTAAWLLWCLSAALWGGLVTYSSVRRDSLFQRRRV